MNHIIKAGNIYAVPINETEYFFFRVLLMVDEQCLLPKLIKGGSELTLFSNCHLIEIFKYSGNNINEYNSEEILYPGIFCSYLSFIKSGKWLYAGFKAIEITEIYFPTFVQSQGIYNAKYIRGEVAIEFEMGTKEVEKINIFPETFPGVALTVLYLYIADRISEIPFNYEDINRFSLSKKDLHFSAHKETVKK